MTPISQEIFKYIDSNLSKDVNLLALKKNPFPSTDWKWILNQIAAKKKAKDKLPTWYNTPQIIFPTTLSVEQTSSELLAKYKANMVSGTSFIDLTGGFGVDTYYLAKQFATGIHCEYNTELSEIAQYNFQKLGIKNIDFYQGNSIDLLLQTTNTFDLIYIDPARRDHNKKKVFLFEDCLPNITAHIDFIIKKASTIMIKSSPLIDINQGIKELKYVKKIIVLSHKNEVKELLWILEKKHTEIPEIEAICIDKKVKNFCSIWQDDLDTKYALPQKYLYEPYSAVMKTGLFYKIGNSYSLYKLHTHSHLYTADSLVDFPGRTFMIENIVPYQKREIKKVLEGQTMNVSTRNFPLSAEQLRKKHKIKDGGNTYTFFTTDKDNNKIAILCKKIEYKD